MSLILASRSAIRAQVLARAGVRFAVGAADVDESAIRAAMIQAAPEAVAAALAATKAAAVTAPPGDLVLGCDQVLVFEDQILGKCADRDEARALLRRMAGKTHRLVSALALRRGGAVVWRYVESAELTMRPLSEDFLDAYFEAEGDEVLYCVGCYRLEGMGIQLFERVAGDYFTVLGLPLLPLLAALRSLGVIAP